jgi:hypothetical protein
MMGHDTRGIVKPDFDEHSRDDLFLNPLSDDCWILTLPSKGDEAQLINAQDADFDFVPNWLENALDHYDMFWVHELTVLYDSYEQAWDSIKNYKGVYQAEMDALYERELNQFSDAGHN